jgi:hypothetical protein
MPPTETTALGHKIKKTRKVKPAVWKTAQSLKPNTQLMDLLTLPKPTERALAMRDAWKFNAPDEQGRPQFLVTQSAVPVTSDSQVIFAPDQITSRGVHRYATLDDIAAVVGDDGSTDFEYDAI